MRRRRRPAPKYGSEAALCEAFVDVVRDEFEVYPETSGWDLLLVCRSTGDQVGVQAKLRANVEVLDQAIARSRTPQTGPNVRAVLVPSANATFRYVASRLDLHVFDGHWIGARSSGATFEPAASFLQRAPRSEARRPCWTPPVEIHTPAGVPNPRSITPWKVGACLLCRKLRDVGYLTRSDFVAAGVSPGFWLNAQGRRPSLLVASEKDGRVVRYRQRPGVVLPDEEYPEVVEALRAVPFSGGGTKDQAP